jgi:multidrug efflux pump subunit AcrA (membrane-fusion protein)
LLAGCAPGPPPAAEAPPPPEVETLRVVPELVRRVTTAVGTLEPEARVLVAAQEEGVVAAVAVREGDRVRAGQVVVELDDRQLRAGLAEAEAALEEARARWRRVETLRAEGVMAEQDVDAARAADSASRQVTVELAIAGAPGAVCLGFLARAHLVLEEIPAALLVPEDAVLRGAEAASFVWLVRDGVATMRPVEVDLRVDGRALISRGLNPGDEVVLSGMARLSDGAPVTVAAAAAGT